MPGNRLALDSAAAFVDGSRDLVLIGPVGAGKTRLACSVLNAVYQATRRAEFFRVPLLLHELQPRSDDAEILRLAIERRVMAAPVVCLDDLGAEREHASDFTRRTLLLLYEKRHDLGCRTIWTTNKSLDALAAMQADDRLASRLAGWADIVELQCTDQRLASRSAAHV